MNKPIHVFGCSLAACAELSGTGLTAVAEEDVQYMWPNVLANKLDTQCYNWSRAGATNRDIAMCAIQAMSEHDGTFIVAWTWPERTNYWKPQLDDLDFNNYIVTLAMISPEFKKLSYNTFISGSVELIKPTGSESMSLFLLVAAFCKPVNNTCWVIMSAVPA